jgi:hypothetical protein
MRQKTMLVLAGKLLPRISQRMRMGTRVGVRPEGIKRVVDGLFDAQPFPLVWCDFSTFIIRDRGRVCQNRV